MVLTCDTVVLSGTTSYIAYFIYSIFLITLCIIQDDTPPSVLMTNDKLCVKRLARMLVCLEIAMLC
jgi:hypothetical protein